MCTVAYKKDIHHFNRDFPYDMGREVATTDNPSNLYSGKIERSLRSFPNIIQYRSVYFFIVFPCFLGKVSANINKDFS